jgi:Tfp pilus assembly protein PilO
MTSIVTAQDTLNIISNAYVGRVQEVHMYQINIDNFTIMLAGFPSDNISDELSHYLDVEIKDLPESLTDEEVQLITDYKYKAELTKRIRTEKAEQSKAQRVLDALKSQIPADQLDTLVASIISGNQNTI